MSEEKGLLGFNGETPDTLGILLHIVGAGGGAGATTLATMLGSCAAEMPRNDLTDTNQRLVNHLGLLSSLRKV